MSARDLVFGSIRRALAVTGGEAPRRASVADRLTRHPAGVVPARGRLAGEARVDLFIEMVTSAAGSAERIADWSLLPAAVASFLRRNDLPLAVRRGADPALAAAPWQAEDALAVSVGATKGDDLSAVSHAFGAVAETGTLILLSGPDNPTTLNFLPDNHIVAVEASAIAPDYETVLAAIRERFGAGTMPRSVNMVTGPSRTADIEQTLILGAHGPRRLHVIVVGQAGS